MNLTSPKSRDLSWRRVADFVAQTSLRRFFSQISAKRALLIEVELPEAKSPSQANSLIPEAFSHAHAGLGVNSPESGCKTSKRTLLDQGMGPFDAGNRRSPLPTPPLIHFSSSSQVAEMTAAEHPMQSTKFMRPFSRRIRVISSAHSGNPGNPN